MLDATALLAIESWTLYALGVGLVLSRLISRLFTLGSLRRLQLDDWIMGFIVVPFTGMVFTANESFVSSTSLSTTRKLRMRFALEELHIISDWLVKACLVILYRRILPGKTSSRERVLLACVSAYCVLSFVLVQVLLPLWCLPVQDYWNPRSHNTQCSTYHSHSILLLTLDTTTITTTFVLPIAFIPTPRKFLQAALLTLGTSILASSILSRYYVLAQATSAAYIHWYIAEITLMILFANLPFLSSLFTTAGRLPGRSTSLTSWPRPYKEHAAIVDGRAPNGSVSKAASTDSPGALERPWSTRRSPPALEFDHVWVENGKEACPVLPMPTRKLFKRETVQEIEVYDPGRRPSHYGTGSGFPSFDRQ